MLVDHVTSQGEGDLAPVQGRGGGVGEAARRNKHVGQGQGEGKTEKTVLNCLFSH